MRAAASEEDWSAIRALLIESQARAGPGWNWDVRRWDGWRFHREQPLDDARLADRIAVWEGPGGRIVAAVHPEARGDAWLELDPGLRELEPEMVEWAETHLAEAPGPDRPARLDLWVRDDDERRARLLEGRGYQPQTDGGAWVRILALDGHPPAGADIDPAYRLRTTTPGDADAVRMAALLNAAFDTTVHTAREYRTFVERSPSFEHELNLVAEAPDGSFAAHVGLTHEPSNRHGIVEPVCTAPGHRRHGLARALLSEGLVRLAARGVRTVQVETGDDAAPNELYRSCGFTDAHHLTRYRRTLARP